MLNRRQFTQLAGTAVLAMAAPVPAFAAPIIIKFSHVVAPDTPKGKGAQKFKELAEKYTNGAVVVEVYPNSQLYKDKEELEALQLGAVHMLAPSLAKFGPLGVQEFELFDLPYLMDGYDALRKITDGTPRRTAHLLKPVMNLVPEPASAPRSGARRAVPPGAFCLFRAFLTPPAGARLARCSA